VRYRVFDGAEKTHAALRVIVDRRERLVQFVREGRRHFAELIEAGKARELALYFLQARRRLLALGEVAHEAGKESLAPRPHLADHEFHREGRPVLAASYDDAVDADDALLTGGDVPSHICIVF